MDELSIANRVHICLEQFDISEDIALRVFLNTLSHSEVAVIAELYYLPQTFILEKLLSRLDPEIQNKTVSVLMKLKENNFIQFDGKTIDFGKEAKKELEPYMERYEEDFEIDFTFLFSNLKQLPVELVPNWFSIHRILTSFQDGIVEKYLATPLLFQRFTTEMTIDDPYAKKILSLLLKKENFEISIEEIVDHFSASREEVERAILCLEFSLVAGWMPANATLPSRVSLVREIKDLYKNLNQRLPSPSSMTPKNFSLNLEERLSHLLTLLSNQCLNKGDLTKGGAIQEWIEIHRMGMEKESLKDDLDLLISLGFVKESSPLVVTKHGFDWQAKSSLARKMDLYLNYRPIYSSSHLSDRAIKQIERSIFEKQPEVWFDTTELAKSLLWTSGEDGGIHLITKGRNWHYQLPTHSESTLDLLEQIIDWLSEIGFLKKSDDLVLIPHESRVLFVQQF